MHYRFRLSLPALLMAMVGFVISVGLPAFGQAACREGYVWREAFPGDYVCVTPDVRAQAARDNSQAKARLQPGSQYCVVPYVWRVARPDDLVCVTVQTRTQAANDNAHAAERVVTTPPRLTPPASPPLIRVPPPAVQATPSPVPAATHDRPVEAVTPSAHSGKTHKAEQHPGEQHSEEKAPEQESFWSGVPGILTALGGFITAVATLVLAFKRQQAKPEAKAEEG